MRLLHVLATDRLRGAEVFASDLVRALSTAGVDQRVVVLRPSARAEIDVAAPLVRAGPTPWRVPGLNLDLRALSALRRVVSEWRPDVVQAHGGEALKHSLGAARAGRCRLVYRRIGFTPSPVRRGARRALHARRMGAADAVVAVAEAVRAETVEVFRVPPERVTTVPNAVDPDRLRPSSGRASTRATLGMPGGGRAIVFVGALSWEKDPLCAVDVAAPLLRERPQDVLVMVGDGPLRPRVEQEVERRRLRGRVLVLGTRGDVADILAASDIALLTSRAEGMPASIIEAGLCGVPVAAFSVAGVPEVIEDEVTGLLAPAADRERLGRALTRLLDDDERRLALGQGAERRCRALFDIARVAPRYLALYDSIPRAATLAPAGGRG